MSDKKPTYEDLVNSIKIFNQYGISVEDIKRQVTPEMAQKILNTITEKDFSHGSSSETSGTIRPHKD